MKRDRRNKYIKTSLTIVVDNLKEKERNINLIINTT